jgi:hypothetical protein
MERSPRRDRGAQERAHAAAKSVTEKADWQFNAVGDIGVTDPK